MQSNNVSLTVKVNSRPVAEYQHEGRCYVEGKEGSAYSLFIKNDNPFRVMVVPSIDGVNVLNGKPATGASDEIGYVLNAYQSFTCDGYRLDNDSVAAFTFSKASASYAKSDKKMEGTTGVIGLRVWKEKVAPAPVPSPIVIEKHIHHHGYDRWKYNNQPWYPSYVWTSSAGYASADSLTYNGQGAGSNTASYGSGGDAQTSAGMGSSLRCCNFSAQSAQVSEDSTSDPIPFDLGSTFGAKIQSKVVNTTFESDYLVVELAIYYAGRAGLKTLGVDVSRTDKVAFPQAFGGQYCTPPSGWKG